jgi:hypothetical protein
LLLGFQNAIMVLIKILWGSSDSCKAFMEPI